MFDWRNAERWVRERRRRGRGKRIEKCEKYNEEV